MLVALVMILNSILAAVLKHLMYCEIENMFKSAYKLNLGDREFNDLNLIHAFSHGKASTGFTFL